MEHQPLESAAFKYLPSGRRVAVHFIVLCTLSCLIGPWLGPWLTNWINPPQVWGLSNKPGNYTPLNVLLWGCAFLMIELFFYTAWLIARARKGWQEAQPKSWYN